MNDGKLIQDSSNYHMYSIYTMKFMLRSRRGSKTLISTADANTEVKETQEES